MGKMNNAIVNYLSDKARFADLINAEVYGGRQVIKPDGLSEITATTYSDMSHSDGKKTPRRKERRGDIAMIYEDGCIYRIFLLEAQDKVSYVFPIRSMEYILSQYKKQIDAFASIHEKNNDYKDAAEKFSKLCKADRLKPEYILCLYLGEEPWDGPRKLSDMMDFGDDHDRLSSMFQDFIPKPVCINELKDSALFKTELGVLMDLLIKRPDKSSLKKMLDEDNRFYKVDEDTYETAAVLMNAPLIWKHRRRYMSDNEGRNYNMCKALRDWEAEIRDEVRKEYSEKRKEDQNKMCKALEDWKVEIREEVGKEYAGIQEESKKKDVQLEQKDILINDLQKENAMLRALLAEARV